MRLPTVVVSSVIRSTHQGESHGGVYLVDLESGRSRQVVDWDDPTISFAGRGADRGLRGIAIRGDEVFLAASDQVLVFDRAFELQRTIANPYLSHCHEITIDGGTLYLSSTGHDAVLAYDLVGDRFTRGWHLQWTPLGRRRQRRLRALGDRPTPRVEVFDPMSADGPRPSDTCHVNNVVTLDGRLFTSGTGFGHLLELDASGARSYARIPYGTHNSRPFGDDLVLCNSTAEDAVVLQTRRGRVVRTFPVPSYDLGELEHTDVPGDHARQAFGRGLCTVGGDVLVAGSSPATVTAYDLRDGAVLGGVNLSRDVRNAVHGLEVWPWGLDAAT